MQIYRGVYGSWKQPDERLQEIREKFPLVHGANLRYPVQPLGAGTAAWKGNDSGVAGICQLCVGDGDAAHGIKISAAARKGGRK